MSKPDSDFIETAIAAAKKDCQQRKLRLTPKRENVLRVVLASTQPLSAYEVIDAYEAQFKEPLPAMTVYRILNFLLDVELIHRLETCNQYLACNHIACDHDHAPTQFLICDECRQVQELSLSQQTIRELHDNAQRCGFVFQQQQIELHGVCSDCQTSS